MRSEYLSGELHRIPDKSEDPRTGHDCTRSPASSSTINIKGESLRSRKNAAPAFSTSSSHRITGQPLHSIRRLDARSRARDRCAQHFGDKLPRQSDLTHRNWNRSASWQTCLRIDINGRRRRSAAATFRAPPRTVRSRFPTAGVLLPTFAPAYGFSSA